MVPAALASLLRRTPTRVLIHGLFGGYGRFRGPELPGTWIVEVMAPLGHRAATVRQSLLRMVRTGELAVERRGRVNHYRLSPFAQVPAQTAHRRLFGPIEPEWDGAWTVAIHRFRLEERESRKVVKVVLDLEAFAPYGRGAHLHPRDRRAEVGAALRAVGLEDRLLLLRGSRSGGPSDERLADSLWDLEALGERYAVYVRRLRPLRTLAAGPTPAQAFALNLGAATAFVQVTWADPELPAALRPASYAGDEARALAQHLVRNAEPGMLEHGDRVMATVGQADTEGETAYPLHSPPGAPASG